MPRKTSRKAMRRRPRRQVRVIRPRIPQNGVRLSETVKLRYSDQINVGNPLGGSVYNFRANSLYDPNKTGTGHQPLGFDQMAEKYNHYVVLGAKIYVQAIPFGTSSSSGDNPAYFMVKTSDNDTKDYDSITHLIESTGKTPKINSNYVYNQLSKPQGNNAKMPQDVATYSARKWFRKDPMDHDDLKALVNANPVEEVNFQIYTMPLLDSFVSTQDSVSYQVTIEYIATFLEPKTLTQS
jgi:hypothetical protein